MRKFPEKSLPATADCACSRNMRPTCCRFRRCARAGHCAAGQPTCRSADAMRVAWSSARSISALEIVNRRYETIESQVARFIDYVTSLFNTDVLCKAGILPGGLWLASVMSNDF